MQQAAYRRALFGETATHKTPQRKGFWYIEQRKNRYYAAGCSETLTVGQRQD